LVKGSGGEKGGASIFVVGLIALTFLSVMVMYQLNAQTMVIEKQRVKMALNRSVHAASLEWDEGRLSEGILLLDAENASRQFQNYLRKGLALDNNLNPLEISFLSHPVKVMHFAMIQEGPFPRVLEHTVTISEEEGIISQTVREVIDGPSVFAILRVVHNGIGTVSDTPYLVSAIEEVKW
jgi:hypothetical protein